MNDTEHKLTVLKKIAEHFNKAGITWAVGASLLLYFKNITDIFHDIDLMVLEDDIEKVKDILSELGTLQPANPNAKYRTHYFLEYVVDDVDIDVMAGFVIVNDCVEYDCSLKKESIAEKIALGNASIPLQSLSTWKRYYTLMGRADKVAMLSSVPDAL